MKWIVIHFDCQICCKMEPVYYCRLWRSWWCTRIVVWTLNWDCPILAAWHNHYRGWPECMRQVPLYSLTVCLHWFFLTGTPLQVQSVLRISSSCTTVVVSLFIIWNFCIMKSIILLISSPSYSTNLLLQEHTVYCLNHSYLHNNVCPYDDDNDFVINFMC